MDRERQKQAPIYAALEAFRRQRVVPFDVPGHKRGRGNPELVELLGEKCVGIDVNSMKPLDNLCHPISVISIFLTATKPPLSPEPYHNTCIVQDDLRILLRFHLMPVSYSLLQGNCFGHR